MPDVLTRVVAALNEVIGRQQAETVAMILLLHVLTLPLSHYWRIRQHPCAINEIDWEDGQFTIGSINQTDHILLGV